MGGQRFCEIWGAPQLITPTCRANRGDDGAFDEAVRRVREVYYARLAEGNGAEVTVRITAQVVVEVPES